MEKMRETVTAFKELKVCVGAMAWLWENQAGLGCTENSWASDKAEVCGREFSQPLWKGEIEPGLKD